MKKPTKDATDNLGNNLIPSESRNNPPPALPRDDDWTPTQLLDFTSTPPTRTKRRTDPEHTNNWIRRTTDPGPQPKSKFNLNHSNHSHTNSLNRPPSIMESEPLEASMERSSISRRSNSEPLESSMERQRSSKRSSISRRSNVDVRNLTMGLDDESAMFLDWLTAAKGKDWLRSLSRRDPRACIKKYFEDHAGFALPS
jgi:hypothetical protein